MRSKQVFATLMLAVLLSTLFCLNFRFVNAQSEPNLAETINNVVSNIQDWSLPWTVLYGQIFGVTNQSSYDTAILQALINQTTSMSFSSLLFQN